MSKIQEALRKLRADTPGRPNVRVNELPSETVATAVQAAEADLPKGNAHSGVSVVVDFELLRNAGLLAPENLRRSVADQYRLIKRPLLDNVNGNGADQISAANLIMIASALPGDGKTFNCINLALSMATEKDTSVVLVDADVAKPHISRLFGIHDQPGLIDLLNDANRDVGDVILNTNIPRFRILPAGRHDEHATELLASRRMAAVVDAMTSKYPNRVVIFDSPPLLATSEARVLAGLMGQIVVVVCAGRTPQAAVQTAVESLDSSKAISLILNQSSKSVALGGYGNYGYGSYGG